ncbi:MAG TPA: cysteine desulfurase family protein [Candidatus Sulfotelmatobacter sp.]|nr:cysteine desulfurase family protein [Candidatus Sulfotelmatobacter sp.]
MIYFDHNASTPVRPEARDAMGVALAELHANPSSLHHEGQRARAAIERAREQVALLVHARPDEVIFVSGGTEGDHAGLIGLALAASAKGRRVAFGALEHHAVHGAAEVLEGLGFESSHLPVDARGVLRLDGLEELPGDATVLALMLANNETGVLQPVREAGEIARRNGWTIHCDAVQAAGKVPVDFEALGVDALVISAHKLGGPKGAGALILRRGTPWKPLFRGSAHERGRRGGTENLPGIVGFGVAAELAASELASEPARLLALRRRFEDGLRGIAPDVVIHGRDAERLPNTVNASFPGARSDHLLMALDARGVAVSAGAACASGAVEPSPVLAAMGVPREIAVCALRFSMGRTTTAAEVGAVLAALAESVPAARSASLSGARS